MGFKSPFAFSTVITMRLLRCPRSLRRLPRRSIPEIRNSTSSSLAGPCHIHRDQAHIVIKFARAGELLHISENIVQQTLGRMVQGLPDESQQAFLSVLFLGGVGS